MPTKKIDEKPVNEFVSDDGYSTLPDAGTGKDNSRPADKKDGETAIPQLDTKADLLAKIMDVASSMPKTDLQYVFSGLVNNDKLNVNRASITAKPSAAVGAGAVAEGLEEALGTLEEDLKVKTQTLFESAVNLRVGLIKVELEESLEATYNEKLTKSIEEMTENLNKYMDYAVTEWMTENALAVEKGLKLEIAEGFLTGLKTLFKEHYIEVPDNAENILESLQGEVDSLKVQLNATINENINLKSELEDKEIENNFKSMSEGLTLTQVEKFKTLAEGLEYTSVEDFNTKLQTIKEAHFPSTKPTSVSTSSSVLNESFESDEGTDNNKTFDPSINSYLDFMNKSTNR